MIIGDPAIQIDAIRKYTVESLDGFVMSPYPWSLLGDEAGLLWCDGHSQKRL